MRRLARGGGAALGLLAMLPAAAAAHADGTVRPHELWASWTFEPLVVGGLVLSAAIYATGVARLWARAGVGGGVRRWQAVCFTLGLLSTAAALVSPLDALGETLFSAHMAQHELLMRIAAPLLVLAAPLPAFLWGIPPGWRRRLGDAAGLSAIRRPWRLLTHPAAAWTIHAVVLWAWHTPALYQATLASGLAHAFQHVSFIASALLFWWVLVHRGRGGRIAYGIGILYVFGTAVHESLLGVLFTFARHVWYPAYSVEAITSWGLTPLEDQQLAGLIMWIPGGFIYLVACLALFAAWLRAIGRDRRRAERARERGAAAIRAGTVLGLALAVQGCSGIQSMLDPAGREAGNVAWLWWGMLAVGGLLWAVLMWFVLYGVTGARVDVEERKRTDRLSTRLTAAGVAITCVVLLGVFAASLWISRDRRSLAGTEELTVEVVGYQFWWEVRYEDPATGDTIVSANELHLPVDATALVRVRSADVIHSLWIPSLGGKIDMLPGRTNEIRVLPEEVGVFRGQCAEFCGHQHAHMALMVEVHPAEEFATWLEREAAPADAPATPAAARGLEVFESSECAECHRIRGTAAAGTNGPDLTHVASRRTLAAGTLANNKGNLGGWIGNPQRIKPGVQMPHVPLSGQDFQAVVEYLGELR